MNQLLLDQVLYCEVYQQPYHQTRSIFMVSYLDYILQYFFKYDSYHWNIQQKL